MFCCGVCVCGVCVLVWFVCDLPGVCVSVCLCDCAGVWCVFVCDVRVVCVIV